MANELAALPVAVEEEFLLVDQETGATVPAATAVGHTASALRPPAQDATIRADLFETQVTAGTGQCADLADATTRLTHHRQVLATAARAVGAWLLPSGTAVLGGPAAPQKKFAALADTYAAVVADHQACACRVTVDLTGADADTVVAVLNHLRPWLPTLLALSVNAPFQDGADTGYASWRTVQRSRLPASGLPPHFASADAYAARVARLVEQGVLVDDRTPLWVARARPAAVELAVADTGIDVPATVLQVALVSALVRTARTDLAAGREAPFIGEQVAAAALWSAARHGMTGPGIHPVLERAAPATVLVSELLAVVRPALEESGAAATVIDGVRALVRTGTGAARQRAAGAPYDAVRMLATGAFPR